MDRKTLTSGVIQSMNKIGYSHQPFYNGKLISYNGKCVFASDVTNAKDLYFDTWEEAAEWLKSVDAWRP